MGLRGWLKRLERDAQGEMIAIPQKDGTVERFPQSVAADAFLSLCEGRDHPLLQAARNSSENSFSSFRASVYATDPTEMRNVEDLSEGARE
jgi:hypothetical protein